MPSARATAIAVLALAWSGCSKEAPPSATGTSDQAATAAPGRRIEPIRRPVRPNGVAGDPAGDPAGAPAAVTGDGRPGGFRGRMAQFDLDGDGVLSDDERRAMMTARAGAVLQRLDTDQDGLLSATELEGSPIARRLGDFAAADADHDGRLSSDEVARALAAQMQDGGWRGARGDHPRRADDPTGTAAPGDGE